MIAHVNDKLFEQCGGDEGIEKILNHFGKYNLSDEAIVLSPEDRKAVQEILDKTISNSAELIAAMKYLTTVNVAGAKFTFTPDQMNRLKDQAQFYGKSLKDYVIDMVIMQMKIMLGEV